MTGHRSTVSSSLVDDSRYESHAELQTPDGHPMLSRQHEYVTIWGYWNGPDDVLAAKDEVVYKGIDALAAYREGRLTQRQYVRVVRAAKTAARRRRHRRPQPARQSPAAVDRPRAETGRRRQGPAADSHLQLRTAEEENRSAEIS